MWVVKTGTAFQTRGIAWANTWRPWGLKWTQASLSHCKTWGVYETSCKGKLHSDNFYYSIMFLTFKLDLDKIPKREKISWSNLPRNYSDVVKWKLQHILAHVRKFHRDSFTYFRSGWLHNNLDNILKISSGN